MHKKIWIFEFKRK